MPLVKSNVSNIRPPNPPKQASYGFANTMIPFGYFQNFTVHEALASDLGRHIYTVVYSNLNPSHWDSEVFFLWTWRVHERALLFGAREPFDYIYRLNERAPALW